MKLVLISDTHCNMDKIQVPDGDVLIHAGDLTYQGTIPEMAKELKLLGELPHKHKVFICGNHDWLGEHNPELLKQMCSDNGIIYLKHSSVVIDCVKIWGSPATPRFFDWAFNFDRGADIKRFWDIIPIDTDILVTHGPPYCIGDKAPTGGHVGCVDLLNAIDRIKPKVHVFGHIHQGYGIYNTTNTTFINASICTEKYKPTNKAIVFEL